VEITNANQKENNVDTDETKNEKEEEKTFDHSYNMLVYVCVNVSVRKTIFVP